MLEETINQHPLLKILFNSRNASEELEQFFGLYECRLERAKGKAIYRISVKNLQIIFFHKCRDRKTGALSVKMLLEFDYSTLLILDPAHPFYLDKNPVEPAIILSGLYEASNSDNKEVFSYLLEKYKNLILEILKEKDLFNEFKAQALSALAKYNPKLVFKHLQQYFSQPFTLNKKLFTSGAYRDILTTLRIIAIEKEYFEFAVTTLLMLATQEGKLGLYPGYGKDGLNWSGETSVHFEFYKAAFELEDLFVNTCSDVKVSLQERMVCLSKILALSRKSNDYFQLYFLIHTLARAANVFESGEYEYVEDPFFDNYIKFCIESLLEFAGEPDKDFDDGGLHFTAEEKLHRLLEISVDEPDIWGVESIPFTIFRGYIHYNKEWDLSPFYILDKLNETIKELKKEQTDESDKEHIKTLELRLEQLISLIGEREFIAEKFILYLGAKNPNKIAEIGVDIDKNSGLNLHERQSLAERLIFSRTTNIYDIERGWPKTTYLIASFGLVITDRPHTSHGNHKRIFKTISIEIEDSVIAGENGKLSGHAEEALYAFLLQESQATSLLTTFKQRYNIKAYGHKVYAIILDLHGTYDMCLSCSKKGLDFQNKFRELMLQCFKKQNLKALTHYPKQLPVIIRYSSDLKYDYPRESQDDKRGILTMYQQKIGRDLATKDDAKDSRNLDIKYYGSNLLIHGKNNWHSFWSKEKREHHESKELSLESWTAFVTARTSSSLTQEARHFNYTRLGLVETSNSDISELEEAMSQSTISNNSKF